MAIGLIFVVCFGGVFVVAVLAVALALRGVVVPVVPVVPVVMVVREPVLGVPAAVGERQPVQAAGGRTDRRLPGSPRGPDHAAQRQRDGQDGDDEHAAEAHHEDQADGHGSLPLSGVPFPPVHLNCAPPPPAAHPI
jgi:hypothetical protein